MVKERSQLYEGMYILSAALSEDARTKAVEKLQEQIVGHGGKVENTIDWGRRRLAYEIDGKREGHYFILYFTAPTKVIKDLWHEYHLNEDLLRFVTMQADEVKETIEFKELASAQQ